MDVETTNIRCEPPVTACPSPQQVHERYLEYLKSRAFTPILSRIAGRPWGHIIKAALAAVVIVTVPISLYHAYKMLTHAKRRRKEMIEVAKLAKPITTYPLMVNSVLNSVPGSIAPGMVIGSFQPRARQDEEYWQELTMKLAFFDPDDAQTPEEKQAARWLNDENYVESKRLLLPKTLTDGCEVYAFHVRIVGDFLPGRVAGAEIPCVAVPGPIGAIQPIPWWIAQGASPPA
jgi:hypothetical protein